jgi:hypothetical protein
MVGLIAPVTWTEAGSKALASPAVVLTVRFMDI